MSVSDLTIHTVGEAELNDLMVVLRALAQTLGDPFHATRDDLGDALFGPERFALALLARRDKCALGALLAAPLFSTMGGGAVLYVSDLWVAPEARRNGVGQRLLAQAASAGAERWNSRSLKLTVDSGNTPAQAFYDRLGFVLRQGDRSAILDNAGVVALQGETA